MKHGYPTVETHTDEILYGICLTNGHTDSYESCLRCYSKLNPKHAL